MLYLTNFTTRSGPAVRTDTDERPWGVDTVAIIKTHQLATLVNITHTSVPGPARRTLARVRAVCVCARSAILTHFL